MLSITREEFRELYHDTSVLEYEDLFYSEPVNDIEYLSKYLPSKLWRLNNVYTIVDKFGKLTTFVMNKAQHKVYAESLRHPRVIILKSRQQGISTLWLVSFFDDMLTLNNFSIGLMAQGDDEAMKLLERTKMLWEKLNPAIKQYIVDGGIRLGKDNTKEFSLSNGSAIFIRTSFRSTTLQRLHISEMAKIANNRPERAKETKTGTLQALAQGNIGIVESTAEGDNMFKSMWDNAVKFSGQRTPKDFSPIFLSWLDDPDCAVEIDQIITDKNAKYFAKIELEVGHKITRQQKNFWVMQYRELGDRIYQEYPSTPIEAFMATKDGSYYARLYLEYVKKYKREVSDLYDKHLDVQLVMDLGMNDTNVIGVFQEYINETRIIAEFYDHNQEIAYYADWMHKQPWFRSLTRVLLPHDAHVKEHTSGLTRKQKYEQELEFYRDEFGRPIEERTNISIEVVPKIGVNDGIEMVRELVKQLYIDPKCEHIIDCIYNYTKEYDEKTERWRDKPLHDKYSNGADMLRYLALGRDEYKIAEIREGRNSGRGRGHDV